jgi:hypothetical protein
MRNPLIARELIRAGSDALPVTTPHHPAVQAPCGLCVAVSTNARCGRTQLRQSPHRLVDQEVRARRASLPHRRDPRREEDPHRRRPAPARPTRRTRNDHLMSRWAPIEPSRVWRWLLAGSLSESACPVHSERYRGDCDQAIGGESQQDHPACRGERRLERLPRRGRRPRPTQGPAKSSVGLHARRVLLPAAADRDHYSACLGAPLNTLACVLPEIATRTPGTGVRCSRAGSAVASR